jgi:hypothetical protein
MTKQKNKKKFQKLAPVIIFFINLLERNANPKISIPTKKQK